MEITFPFFMLFCVLSKNIMQQKYLLFIIFYTFAKNNFDSIEFSLQNSEVLFGRLSQHDRRKNALVNYWYQTFYYVCHLKSVFLPQFPENQFRK